MRNEYIPGMALRQRIHTPALLDSKTSRPIAALQILEPIDRDPAGTGCELQQPRLLLRVPASDDIPEIAYHRVGFGVAAVVGVLLPVVDVNVRDTAN